MATVVAVAVNVGGSGRGNGSKRAVRWAVERLLFLADRFVLVHVMPTITHIPTPSGDRTSIKDIDARVAATYIKDVRKKAQEIFHQYKAMNKPTELEFETVLLECDNVAAALLNYITESGIKILVMGSATMNPFWRKKKGPGVPRIVLKGAPNNTDVFVVYRRKLKKKLSSSLTMNDILTEKHTPSVVTYNKIPVVQTPGQTPLHSSSSTDQPSTGISSWSELSRSEPSSDTLEEDSCADDEFDVPGYNNHSPMFSMTPIHTPVNKMSMNGIPASPEQVVLPNEVEQIRVEIDNTIALYSSACENLVHAQKKVRLLSSDIEEAEKIDAAAGREGTLRRTAELDKMKRWEATKEVQAAKDLLAKESYERQIAELKALIESKERQSIVEALISSERSTRKYTPDQIKMATDCFSENKVLGEGSYGKVYKGVLDHTAVAIKVLESDANDKKEEFLKEVEILSQLHHPNIVLLLGVCPEMGCLVYEYMENGSLEEHIFQHDGQEPLPWFARFRIAFEIACGLAFLHSKKPVPIVHRDLKPGNILLGRHCVGKISDVGLAAILPKAAPDSLTMFGSSLVAGTLYYMDPEYQRTGTVRPKSDLYSFGIIILQMLTGRRPNGLLTAMENAIANKSLHNVLDKTITDWPVTETEELVHLALECCKLRCRDRPDLEEGVLPVLKKLADIADASMKLQKHSKFVPRYYFCPILHEIMDDPHIAADGFTYERRAIQAWLEKHEESPLTERKLEHFNLTPNKTLRSAIQEWRSSQSTENT